MKSTLGAIAHNPAGRDSNGGEKKGEGCVSHTVALYTASPSSGANKQAAHPCNNKRPGLADAGWRLCFSGFV